MEDIKTVDDARQFALEYQEYASNTNLSYGQISEWQMDFAELVEKFPELEDEFKENGLI